MPTPSFYLNFIRIPESLVKNNSQPKLNNLQKVKLRDLKVYFAEQGQSCDEMVTEIIPANILISLAKYHCVNLTVD